MISRNLLTACLLLGVIITHAVDPVQADEAKLPLQADDLVVLRRIVEREQLTAPPEVVTNGWPLQKGDTGIRFASKDNPRHVLTVVPDARGRVVKYLGNGPILSNASFADVAKLSELRVIRIDHNIPGPGSTTPHERYNGAGFTALEKSKLEEVRIGHAFDDKGMAALAKVASVKFMDISHSKVTDQGLQVLKNHPSLEVFHISSQGRPERVTDKCIAVFATLPNLKELGLHETFLTYEGGLKHLSTSKTLTMLSLKTSLVIPSDIERLKKDLPKLTVETSSPAEILESPNSRGVARWASPEAKEYLKTGEKK
ncbi:MAG: hypothetical protein ACK4RK_16105 [Gemmataceae bacterium]